MRRLPEPRPRRPIDPEGPQFVPEDVYPDDPLIYEEGLPPDPEPPNEEPQPEPDIIVEIDEEPPPEDGIPDDEEVVEDDGWPEPDLPPDELPPMDPVPLDVDAKVFEDADTDAATMRVAPKQKPRFPVFRVVPRILYYQRFHGQGGSFFRRLAVVRADHIVNVSLAADEFQHHKVGTHSFVFGPADDETTGKKQARQLRFKLDRFQRRLGLLPDWDYQSTIDGVSYKTGTPTPKKYACMLMLTVQRKRRERTIMIPVREFVSSGSKPPTRAFQVQVLDKNGQPAAGVGIRLGGVDADALTDATGLATFTAAPKCVFMLTVDKDSLPTGQRMPGKRRRTVDLHNPKIKQPYVITLRERK